VNGLPDGIFSNYKNPYLGKFWWVLQWKMLGHFIAIWPFYGHLVYFVAIWPSLRPFGLFCGHFGIFCGHFGIFCSHFGIFCGYLVYFSRFGILCQENSGNPKYVTRILPILPAKREIVIKITTC
jgi:hypothetical protein